MFDSEKQPGVKLTLKVTGGLNQISMKKLKSRYKHEQFRKCSVLIAYAGLYSERLSLKKTYELFQTRPK